MHRCPVVSWTTRYSKQSLCAAAVTKAAAAVHCRNYPTIASCLGLSIDLKAHCSHLR